jgi:hypothetical protein
MKRLALCTALGFLSIPTIVLGQAGWKTLKSPSIPPAKRTPGGKCQIEVPANWIADNTFDRAQAHSPDGRAQASVTEYPATPVTFSVREKNTLADYKNHKAALLRTYHQDVLDIQIVDNSPTHLSVVETSTEPLSSGVKTWTLMSSGDPVCYALISVNGTAPTANAADHAASQQLIPVAQKIAASFGPAK